MDVIKTLVQEDSVREELVHTNIKEIHREYTKLHKIKLDTFVSLLNDSLDNLQTRNDKPIKMLEYLIFPEVKELSKYEFLKELRSLYAADSYVDKYESESDTVVYIVYSNMSNPNDASIIYDSVIYLVD